MKRKILLLFTIIIAITACSDKPTGPEQESTPAPAATPPTVSITSPDDDASFYEGETVVFKGEAVDEEDGELSGGSLVWSSTLDEQIGTGAEFALNNLSVGEHTITLTATNSAGLEGEDSVEISIVEEGKSLPPTVSITSPQDGASFYEGETVVFKGEAVDEKDGELSGGSLVWESSLDGQIGTGNEFNHEALSLGNHVITLTATNSAGLEGEDSVEISIVEESISAPNITMSVRLPGPEFEPEDNPVIADGEAVLIEWSVDNDPENCYATEGWSGNKSFSGEYITEGLPGPQDIDFTLVCENRAGSTEKRVTVSVDAEGDMYALTDRPDEKGGKKQVKVFYVVPNDHSRDLDLLPKGGGGIIDDVNRFQQFFMDQTDGSRLRMDTYGNGKLDITRIVLHETFSEMEGLSHTQTNSIIFWRLREMGLEDPTDKKYLLYYDGHWIQLNGFAQGPYASVYIRQEYHDHPPADMTTKPTALHEVFHTLGAVHPDAPNHNDNNRHHVSEPCPAIVTEGTIRDMMCGGGTLYNEFGPGFPVIDYGRNDYYNGPNDEGDLPEGITNIARSPWIIHP